MTDRQFRRFLRLLERIMRRERCHRRLRHCLREARRRALRYG